MKNKKLLGGFLILAAVFMLFVSLVLGGPKVNLITGALLFIVGIVYVTKDESSGKKEN